MLPCCLPVHQPTLSIPRRVSVGAVTAAAKPLREAGRYGGSGSSDVNDAANCSCPLHGNSLLKAGFDGLQAGANARLFTGE